MSYYINVWSGRQHYATLIEEISGCEEYDTIADAEEAAKDIESCFPEYYCEILESSTELSKEASKFLEDHCIGFSCYV